MANGKLELVVSDRSAASTKPQPLSTPNECEFGQAMPDPEDANELVRAFCRIRDPERRAWLIEQARALAQ